MDELIKKILRELNVDECFIENDRSYRVLKFYVRTRLTDIYKYHIYINKEEKAKCSKEEIKNVMAKENCGWNTVRDFICVDDVKMLKFLETIKTNKEKWNKVIGQLKENNPILSIDFEINVKPKQLNVTYFCRGKREKTYMYYDRMSGCVDILYVQENIKQEKKEKSKKPKKKVDRDLEFSEYEKIRFNIYEKEEIKSIGSGKKEPKQEESKLQEEPKNEPIPIQESMQINNDENDDKNKTYYIMFEKVKKDGSIAWMDIKNYYGYLDKKQITIIVNKLEAKYNNDIIDKIAEVATKGEELVKKVFYKGNAKDKNDDDER